MTENNAIDHQTTVIQVEKLLDSAIDDEIVLLDMAAEKYYHRFDLLDNDLPVTRCSQKAVRRGDRCGDYIDLRTLKPLDFDLIAQ